MSKRPTHIFLLVVLMAVLAFASVRLLGGQTTHKETAAAKTEKNEAPTKQPVDSALAAAIDRVFTETDIGPARFGVFVMTRDGHVLYSRNAEQLFTPASNMKVYTTAVALD